MDTELRQLSIVQAFQPFFHSLQQGWRFLGQDIHYMHAPHVFGAIGHADARFFIFLEDG